MTDEESIRADERARCIAIALAVAEAWKAEPGNAATQRAFGATAVANRIRATEHHGQVVVTRDRALDNARTVQLQVFRMSEPK